MSFTKLRLIYKVWTGRNFEEYDYESFSIIDDIDTVIGDAKKVRNGLSAVFMKDIMLNL